LRESDVKDDLENLVALYLRRLDGKIDRVLDDIRDLKVRMTAVEGALTGVNRRMDQIEGRIDPIEKCLMDVEAD
jgi:hypothetical protein